MTPETADYIDTAVARLGSRRRPFCAALADQRDRAARAGQTAEAELWSALAVLLAESHDDEVATLRALDFHPGTSAEDTPGEPA